MSHDTIGQDDELTVALERLAERDRQLAAVTVRYSMLVRACEELRPHRQWAQTSGTNPPVAFGLPAAVRAVLQALDRPHHSVVGLMQRALVKGNRMMGSMRGHASPADEEMWIDFELALAELVEAGYLEMPEPE